MAIETVLAAMCQCTMGVSPGSLMVLPEKMVLIEGKPAANIMDNKPMVNVMSFGICSAIPNAPTPCIPAPAGP